MAATTIALLAFVAVATVAEEVCVEKSRGLLVGMKHDTQVHVLPAGQNSYEIEIPSPCRILTSGVKVQVCEPHAPATPPTPPTPYLDVPSLHHASVYRPVSRRAATLTATVYCLVGRSGIDVQSAGDYEAIV